MDDRPELPATVAAEDTAAAEDAAVGVLDEDRSTRHIANARVT